SRVSRILSDSALANVIDMLSKLLLLPDHRSSTQTAAFVLSDSSFMKELRGTLLNTIGLTRIWVRSTLFLTSCACTAEKQKIRDIKLSRISLLFFIIDSLVYR